MNDETQSFSEHGAAFQKLWLNSMAKVMRGASNFSPESSPPEILREMRNGMLQALGESWNEFLRSPQFQQQMKQWMESAVAVRKLSNDFMSKVRKEMQAPSRDDIDAIQLNMRHLETRILDRLEALSKQVEELKHGCDSKSESKTASPKRRKASARPASRTNNPPDLS